MEKIRLQKFFTDCGVMSRRSAEKEIEAGRVTVNGTVAALGDKIDPQHDTVLWNGKQLKKTSAQYTYIMLNKPMSYVTTLSDEKGRKTVMELLTDLDRRVYPVGRLDMYSEGLLIFTDDGELANRLTHPRGDVSKEYSVKIKGNVTPEQMKILTSPMELDGYKLRPVRVSVAGSGVDREDNENTVLHMTLFEGRNRQIRRMCEKAGLTVMRLRRTSECSLKLGNLPIGKWRFLTEKEIEELKKI